MEDVIERRNGAQRPILLGPDGTPLLRDTGDGFGLKHPETFSGIANAITHTYRSTFDEALLHSASNARNMLNDCFLTSLINERILPTVHAPWHLEPENPKDPQQAEVADGITKILQAIPQLLRIKEALMWGCWWGRAAANLLWARKQVQGRDVQTPMDFRPVNGDKIQWHFDGWPIILIHSGYAQDYQARGAEIVRTDKANGVLLRDPYWRQQFAVYKHDLFDADYLEPELAGAAVGGLGIRGRIYWCWWLRDEFISWLSDFFERVGMGVWVYFYESGNVKSEAAARKAAETQSKRNVILMPLLPGQDQNKEWVKFVAPDTSGASALREVISDYFEGNIERYIIGQTMSNKAEPSGLGSNLADFHMDTKFRIIAGDAGKLDECLTTDLVYAIQQRNYPWAKFPVRHVNDLAKPNTEKQLQGTKTVFDMGAKVDEAEVLSMAGLSKPQEGEPFLQKGVTDGPPQQPPGMSGMPPAGPGQPPGTPQPASGTPMPQPKPGAPPAPPWDGNGPDRAGAGDGADLAGRLRFQRRLDWLETTVQKLAVRYDRPGHERAPKGGVTISGTFYTGGEWIPGHVVAQASPEVKAQIAAGKEPPAEVASAPAKEDNEDDGEGKRPATRGPMQEARREGKGKDARIVMADGSPAPAHIKPGMVSPKWTDVKVGTDPDADVLVTGKDDKGRPKTVYADTMKTRNTADKFARTREFMVKSEEVASEIQAARQSTNPKTREAADCAWLMQEQATRPGSDKDTKAEKKAYGATTLRAEHVVHAEDGVHLQFVGKKGVWHDHLIEDEDLAAMLLERKKQAKPMGATDRIEELASEMKANFTDNLAKTRQELLASGVTAAQIDARDAELTDGIDDYMIEQATDAVEAQGPEGLQERGKLFDTNYDQVTDFVKGLDGGLFSCKDFRTKRANELALRHINDMPAPKTEKAYKKAVKDVAIKVSGVLGNKYQECLKSYISPEVFSGWKAGLHG